MQIIEAPLFFLDKDTKVGGGSPKLLEYLLNLPDHRVTVSIPIGSKEYQNFLAANKAVEEARDKNGYLDNQYLVALRTATKKVDELARRIYNTNHSG